MNANADTHIKPTTAEIEKRVADERNRLNAELGLQGRLQAQRLPALETGDDDALNVIEANLTGCLDRQSRIEERIELLTSRLEETNAHEESTRLDEITAAAERSRAEAEKLIRNEYVRAAKALATVLAKLKASDELIESTNRILDEHNRPNIASANNLRCRPAEQFEWTERKVVTAGDPAHPRSGDVEMSRSGGNGLPVYRERGTGQLVLPAEVDVPHTTYVPGDYATPLWQAIVLPSIEPAPRARVHERGNQVIDQGQPPAIWDGPLASNGLPLA